MGRKAHKREPISLNKSDMQKPPYYKYVRPGVGCPRMGAIPVYFETQDPNFFLTGPAATTAVFTDKLDQALYAMLKEERRKARTAFYLLKTVPDLGEQELQKMRKRSRQLFTETQSLSKQIEEARGDYKLSLMEKKKELDDEMHSLVEQNKMRDKVFTLDNPWMNAMLKYDDVQRTSAFTHEMAYDICECIVIKAMITDKEWLKKPIYPDEPDYEEPEMEILGITAYPVKTAYRDLLPGRFWSKFSMRNFPAKGRALYKEWIKEQGTADECAG